MGAHTCAPYTTTPGAAAQKRAYKVGERGAYHDHAAPRENSGGRKDSLFGPIKYEIIFKKKGAVFTGMQIL